MGLIRRYSNHAQAHHLHDLAEQATSAQSAPCTTTHPSQVDRPSQHFHINRRLSPSTIIELVAAYKAGTNTPELCERYNIAKGSVLKLLQDHGVTMRRQPLTEHQIDQAVTLYEAGQSLATIGTQLGSSPTTIRAALNTRGVVMRPAGGSKPGHKRQH